MFHIFDVVIIVASVVLPLHFSYTWARPYGFPVPQQWVPWRVHSFYLFVSLFKYWCFLNAFLLSFGNLWFIWLVSLLWIKPFVFLCFPYCFLYPSISLLSFNSQVQEFNCFANIFPFEWLYNCFPYLIFFPAHLTNRKNGFVGVRVVEWMGKEKDLICFIGENLACKFTEHTLLWLRQSQDDSFWPFSKVVSYFLSVDVSSI